MAAAIPTSHSFPTGLYDDSKESIYTQLNSDTTKNINLDIINYETKLAKKLFKISQMEIPGEGKLDFKYKHRKLVYTGEDRKFGDQCAELYARCLENEKIRHYLERENIQLDDFIFNYQEIKEGLKAKRQAINKKYGRHGFKVNVETGDILNHPPSYRQGRLFRGASLRNNKKGTAYPGGPQSIPPQQPPQFAPSPQELKAAGVPPKKKWSWWKKLLAIVAVTGLGLAAIGAGLWATEVKKEEERKNLYFKEFYVVDNDGNDTLHGYTFTNGVALPIASFKSYYDGRIVSITDKCSVLYGDGERLQLIPALIFPAGFESTEEFKKIMDVFKSSDKQIYRFLGEKGKASNAPKDMYINWDEVVYESYLYIKLLDAHTEPKTKSVGQLMAEANEPQNKMMQENVLVPIASNKE